MVCLQCKFSLSWRQIHPAKVTAMTDVVVLGFPRSTYVHIVRLVLAHKGVVHSFRDLEPEMGSASHLALHPFDRVPILQHGDFTLYETSAIATYVDEAFEGPPLQPVKRFRTSLPPRNPIEHARKWAVSHRPKY